MTFVVQMLAHTPPYVFLLLAYLTWQGVKSLRTRRRSVWTMLIVPALVTATGLSLLVLRPSGDIPPMAAWLVGLMAFGPLGLVTGERPSDTGGKSRVAGAQSIGFRHPVWNCRHPLSSPGGASEPRRCWARGLGHFRWLFHWLDDRVLASLPRSTRCCRLEPDPASIA
jgi:hypothetical protein